VSRNQIPQPPEARQPPIGEPLISIRRDGSDRPLSDGVPPFFKPVAPPAKPVLLTPPGRPGLPPPPLWLIRHVEPPHRNERQLPRQVPQPEAAPAVARLRIEGSTVALDGQPVPLGLTEESRGAAACLLRHLLAAAGDWRSSTELNDMERAGPCMDHIEVRWDRVRKRLPPGLRSLIESDRRKGYRLSPAAWHR
jgi:hypothetical protein